METKDFHLGDILSVTTDVLVSPRHIKGVYDILSFMTGDKVYTQQIPRVIDECKPYLLKQHPELAEVEVPELNEKTVKQWLASQVKIYGETLTVKTLPKGAHKKKDPIVELVEMTSTD